MSAAKKSGPSSIESDLRMNSAVKPYPLITDAIRRGARDELIGLFERFPEMWDLDVPAFGTWLHFASAHGTLPIVQYLVQHGFDPDLRDENGCNPAALAAVSGKADILDCLLSSGSQIDVSDSVRNPLFGAILSGSSASVERLLEAGIDRAPSYQFGSAPERLDAVAFAVLHGQGALARMIASKQSDDPRVVDDLLEAALAKAHLVTAPAP